MNMHVEVTSAAEIEVQAVAAVNDLLSRCPGEEALACVGGDLREAAARYIGNDRLYTGKSNPQIACELHLSLADFWLGVVAAKPIEGADDFDGKLSALLHHLSTDDQLDLPDSAATIVGQLREYLAA